MLLRTAAIAAIACGGLAAQEEKPDEAELRKEIQALKETVKKLRKEIQRLKDGEPVDAYRARSRDFMEKAVLYRSKRRPEQLLEVLKELRRMHPRDSAVLYCLGEVYASGGEHFDKKKAEVSFKMFLDVTSDKNSLDEPMHRMLQSGKISDVRMSVQETLLRLEDGGYIVNVTPLPIVRQMQDDLRKDVAYRQDVIRKVQDAIRACENKINQLRNSRQRYHLTHIRTLEKQIAKQQARVEREEARIARANKTLQEIAGTLR